jgi:hypothetical protein
MNVGSLLAVLFLVALTGLAVVTLVLAARGGRGPADPPASHPRTDPAGFPVPAQPRGVLHRRPRSARRTAGAPRAAVVHTARERRTARRMSAALGARPFPSTGRSSTRLP